MKTTFFFFAVLLFALTTAAQQPSDLCQSLKQEKQEMETRLRDWPELARYREANTQVGTPAKRESRVVFLGDSITDMWKLSDSFPGKPYVNRGISGQTTPQMLLRFRQDVIALKPRVVVILAGTNDIAENTGPITLEGIEDNLMSMAELAQKNGIRVVFASVLPAARYPWKPSIQPVGKIRSLNQWMKQYAAQTGEEFLDYFTALADQESALKAGLGDDGVHPNPAAYAIMAPLAEKAIAKALSKK
jgi:lysophospholipase L1-like esterase